MAITEAVEPKPLPPEYPMRVLGLLKCEEWDYGNVIGVGFRLDGGRRIAFQLSREQSGALERMLHRINELSPCP